MRRVPAGPIDVMSLSGTPFVVAIPKTGRDDRHASADVDDELITNS
jgi:hypothetical protein